MKHEIDQELARYERISVKFWRWTGWCFKGALILGIAWVLVMAVGCKATHPIGYSRFINIGTITDSRGRHF